VRISELAAACDVSTATVKYYLREELIPPGRRTSATQAQYDDRHVQRLKLARALLATGLSISTARDVLAHLDAPVDGVLDLLAQVQTSLTPPDGDVDRSDVVPLLERWGWEPAAALDGPVAALSRALANAEDAGFAIPPVLLDVYADAARSIAEAEIAALPTDSPEASVRYMVLGTILMEPVLLALRRLAEADASARRFA
jgi:DNA-binding transcriptional MerR regulator